MSSVEFPPEVLALILKKVDIVKEYCHLGRVNRLFHGLVNDVCWPTQVRALQINSEWIRLKTRLPTEDEELDWKDRVRKLLWDPAGVQCLAEKVAWDAKNLTGIYLHLNQYVLPDLDGIHAPVIQCLETLAQGDLPKLSVFHLCIRYLPCKPLFPALSQFIASKASTLKTLSLKINYSGLPHYPPFLLALESCTCVESLELGDFSFPHLNEVVALLRSVLTGAVELKTLKLTNDGTLPFCHEPLTPVFRMIPTGQLDKLHQFSCRIDTFEEYSTSTRAACHHPLQNLQELSLNRWPMQRHDVGSQFLTHFPFDKFPQLHTLHLDRADAQELCGLIRNYVSHQQVGSKKALELVVQEVRVNQGLLTRFPKLPLDQVLVSSIQETVQCTCTPFASHPDSKMTKLAFHCASASVFVKITKFMIL